MEETKNKNKVDDFAWYFKPWAIIFAVFAVGPLGLLVLWFRPRTSLRLKIGISVVVIGLSVWLSLAVVEYYNTMMIYYKELGGTLTGM